MYSGLIRIALVTNSVSKTDILSIMYNIDLYL